MKVPPWRRIKSEFPKALTFTTSRRVNAEVARQRAAGIAPMSVKIDGDTRGQSRECGPTTQLRVFATLRAAVNAAVRQRKINWNPCNGVELETAETAERQRWTPAEAARFIAATASDPMGLMLRVGVLRGCRRAELCGFRWADAELEKPYRDPATGEERRGAVLTVERPIVQLGGKLRESKAKTRAGKRPVFLDHDTAELLREHRKAQLKAGQAWADNDLVFCQHDGRPWNPDHVSKRFKKLAAQAGHADRAVNDRYTHPLEQAHLAASEQTAALVRKAAKAS